jgi:hypothetical protein
MVIYPVRPLKNWYNSFLAIDIIRLKKCNLGLEKIIIGF